MPAEIRDKNILKKPFGTLVLERDITKERILSMLANAKKIITVGDASTERLITFGITPDIAVIDGLERRSRRDQRIRHLGKEMSCTNPAGMISKEAIHVLEIALKTPPPVTVKVQGEEDLLALPLFIMAPKGSAVLYGQPLQGIVLVNVTDEKKNQAKDIMDKNFS
ncbi:MAG: GTP-dependent dephospho-CoA kinase family protein [Thermoproteota archaeon]|nr:GTP-dependent dephospho-CoA kinase family protein [Thermoproteota archaeon]